MKCPDFMCMDKPKCQGIFIFNLLCIVVYLNKGHLGTSFMSLFERSYPSEHFI